ncbi:hypothetical protein TUM4438_10170 [Shewanella sairae]|uniref:Uncharacterized protein n=1 Tax=Shewanella sairae TaxID=190310 RepID=A0ABQ4P6N1_9GAMM|nr:hypothetical protein [Shewanella sairae]MCL1130451.1 hypothetical protein [Shewanella sairae]GIU42791.1 hypothetical protein TUM4438_10170 [Shewanella sairae]
MSLKTERQIIAETILQQLGGQRFIAFTGAKQFVAIENGLMFALPARLAREGVNKIRVLLDPNDTYTLEALKVNARAGSVKTIGTESDIYCDSLTASFERLTGLYTHF